jgi:hypothetical protein
MVDNIKSSLYLRKLVLTMWDWRRLHSHVELCIYRCVCTGLYNYRQRMKRGPIPEDPRSKAWVCGRSLAGIAGSNPADGMDVCLL